MAITEIELKEIDKYLKSAKIKAVTQYDFNKKTVIYNEKIKSHRTIKTITGDEEIVRMYILTKLVNELGYGLDKIELEKEYTSGRPKTITSRIDIIVKDSNECAFLFIEVKSPEEYEKDKDETIEEQLFGLAAVEKGKIGNKVKYLALYSVDIFEESIDDKVTIIDYEIYGSFSAWKKDRNAQDTLPKNYGKAIKKPFIKGEEKDLSTKYTHAYLDSIRKNLHNVLWGGGGTDDNDVFSSLTNLILAKIQDESEKKKGEKYDFQIFAYNDNKENFEDDDTLFERINLLYRRALSNRMYVVDKKILEKSYVIDTNKFSLSKLKYTVSELERYSFVDGKNSLDGKDILGDFFEGIIRDGFKQSKGQFFTHINIVRFILWGLKLDKLVLEKINNETEMPLMIDPSAGSGTFLIEYMKFVTQNIKYDQKEKLDDSRDIVDKYSQWFLPDNRENKWAKDYIYGSEINFNLGTAAKVNMILHGDGSTNIFVKDGLLSFENYEKETTPNAMIVSKDSPVYPKKVNEQFDIIVSNPPFSVKIDKDTAEELSNNFVFGKRKNSENLFIERYYQLLKENGRMGIVLPESIFDTNENKYIRLFLFKYFEIKAVVSLPQVSFSPYTTTKTSILFARKKSNSEVESWQEAWSEASKEWSQLSRKAKNILNVELLKEPSSKYKSIKNLTEKEKKIILADLLEVYSEIDSRQFERMELIDIIMNFRSEIEEILKPDNDKENFFGKVNFWWVYYQTSKELNNEIFFSEAISVGYKRTKRGENKTINDLFEVIDNSVVIDNEENTHILNHMRSIEW